jgi:hypothetical protein
MTKMFSTFRVVEKVTGGDFRGLARLIVANKPKEAGELCKQLEAAAAALRTELAATMEEDKSAIVTSEESEVNRSDLEPGNNL